MKVEELEFNPLFRADQSLPERILTSYYFYFFFFYLFSFHSKIVIFFLIFSFN